MQFITTSISHSWSVTLYTVAVYIAIAILSLNYYLARGIFMIDLVAYTGLSLVMTAEVTIGNG